MRPGVGLSPQMPLKCAGTRMDPPPSLPTPPAEHPDAMAAASPPLDPPGVRERSQGLLVRPYRRLSVSQAINNSGVFVTPRIIAPALRNRETKGASGGGTWPARNLLPLSQRNPPPTSIELLMLSGTPCSGPKIWF